MCAVSNVGDRFRDRFYERPWFPNTPTVPPPANPIDWSNLLKVAEPQITRAEFDTLKADVAEMKELLKAAKKQDDEAGTPMCEMEEKMALLRAVAKIVGVSLDDVIGVPA